MADTVGVLGTGMVALTLVGKLSELGYEVWVGARSGDSDSLEPFAQIDGVRTGSFADAAAAAELLIERDQRPQLRVGAVDGGGRQPRRQASHRPVERPRAGRRRLLASDGEHGALDRKAAADGVSRRADRQVAEHHSLNNKIMVDPSLVPGDHVVFMSGDSGLAKDRVAALLQSFGWRPQQIVDLGGIDSAVGPEMAMVLWMKVAIARGFDAQHRRHRTDRDGDG